MMNFEDYPIQNKKDETIQLDTEGNKFQIKKGNFEYFVDIEKGVVAALMRYPMGEASKPRQKVTHLCHNNEIYLDSFHSLFEKYLSKPIRAKAICAEEDEFVLETGMRIARERCLAKYYKRLTNAFIELNNKIDPVLSYIEDKCIFYADKYQKYSD